ncbi:hypothetical protein [Streptomyces sp. CA2R106]|uniref:hypothetical protein n=1 Tax=Streptomyces sp. CA2R106 TaxID=3120153 RepID=UPI00300B0812
MTRTSATATAPATASATTPATAPAAVSRRAHREPGEVFGAGFTLFADMLLVGVVTAVACLPVVTAPAALSAASAALRRSAATGVQVKAGDLLAGLRERLTSSALTKGLLPPAFAVLLLLDERLLRAGLPGAGLMAPVLLLLAVGAAAVGLRAVALDGPHRLCGRQALARSLADPRGTALLAAAAVLAAVLVWAMPVLLPLLPGPLALAATAVDVRHRPPAVSGTGR